jgi:hypothetical protein
MRASPGTRLSRPSWLGTSWGVYVGHVVVLREFRDHEAVIKSQFVMLVLMVGYTTASLWILAQPIIEFGGSCQIGM